MVGTRWSFFVALFVLPLGSLPAQEVLREPIVGLPCEGCEAVFAGLPKENSSFSRIAPEGEPGEEMVIQGRVLDEGGLPAPGIILYAYHTDAGGIYPKDEALTGTAAYRHGRFRGWVKTDSAGRYRFETIRPGGYPGSRNPAHVHMHVIEPGRCTYYIASIEFEDDPRLLAEHRKDQERARGGSGLVSPELDSQGHWFVKRDIVLGLNIPDYQNCSQ